MLQSSKNLEDISPHCKEGASPGVLMLLGGVPIFSDESTNILIRIDIVYNDKFMFLVRFARVGVY